LATVLIVRGGDGAAIAPADVTMTTADNVLSTRDEAVPAGVAPIDQVLPAMRYVRDQNFGPKVVHVIDREADSVNHWRQWSAAGHRALVRGDDRKVLHAGQETTLAAVADAMRGEGLWKDAGPALYRGRQARLFVAEAAVVLHRAGKRNVGSKKIDVPGEPLPLRLVVAEVRDLKGRVLARWLLLTNTPAEWADAATVARWYYFRWRIETMHKLLKSAGWQLEGWLQRNGPRIFKKLLIALGACAAVWELERRQDQGSKALQALLMQLSGRQTKRRQPVTTTGLLAGLWVLQSALDPLARHGPEKLNAMLEEHLPLFAVAK
jgi:Transposase DDE domain